MRLTALLVVFALSFACKPTYIDPVTHEEVACSQLPSVDLDYVVTLVATFASMIPDWGAIQVRAIQEGVARGGCAIAALVNRYLSPPKGIAVPPPEESVKARDALEGVRKHFGGKVLWVNSAGQAQ
jgi:hypothetical protein